MRPGKTKLPIFIVLAMLMVVVSPSRAGAWNSKGHWVTAYVAYKNLTPAARAKVDKLLRAHPDYRRWRSAVLPGSPSARVILSPTTNLAIFVRASTWADDIRGDSRFYSDGGTPKKPVDGYASMERHNSWHFMEIPFSTDGTSFMPVSSTTLLDEIVKLRAEIGRRDVKDSEQAYNLVWLIHLVGDVHQPLHCVTRYTKAHGPPLGDFGGNGFRIKNGSRTTNLHGYWDSLPTDTFTEKTVSSWMKLYPPPKPLDLSPKVWADENLDLAKQVVYTIGPDQPGQPPPTVSRSYALKATLTARQRVVLAGYRLAGILNEAFKD
jgi:hypothetical protein